ncbi:MAG: hypothetical protein BWZ03_00358 [bacterium ADurb.BinA186]|nr:MAG: hypothetical protein BWZ03_00358 [bacterium ADurb.BinA186]
MAYEFFELRYLWPHIRIIMSQQLFLLFDGIKELAFPHHGRINNALAIVETMILTDAK